MLKRGLVALVLAAACGSGGDDEAGGSCEPLDGAFDVTLSETSGTCDAGTWDDVWVFSGRDMAELPPNCEGYRRAVDDGCAIDMNQTCDIYDPNTNEFLGTITFVGRLDISGGGLEGRATWNVDGADGTECRSVIEVSGRPQ